MCIYYTIFGGFGSGPSEPGVCPVQNPSHFLFFLNYTLLSHANGNDTHLTIGADVCETIQLLGVQKIS